MTPRSQVIVVAAILALAGAVDFVQRIHMPRSTAISGAGMEATALPDLPLSLASARQRLQSWLPTQTSGPQAASNDVANESRDSGVRVRVPDRADLGGWRFVLRGVFDAGPPFAVLDVMPSAGGEIEAAGLVFGRVRLQLEGPLRDVAEAHVSIEASLPHVFVRDLIVNVRRGGQLTSIANATLELDLHYRREGGA